MQINKSEMVEFAEIVAQAVIKAISQNGNSGKQLPKQEKTAFQKTEQLLYNYNGFKRIINERMQEIEDLRKYGVPQKSSGAMGERVQTSRTNVGIVLEEESVEAAVRSVQASVEQTIRAINLIDKSMNALRNDPYYEVLPMRYFEGRTQEDIAVVFGCSQQNISNNKNRLVRELSMRIFPNQTVNEMLQ